MVKPCTNGIASGMRNVVLQDVCPNDYSEHGDIAASHNAVRLVFNALDYEHSRPVRCVKVLPGLGPLL